MSQTQIDLSSRDLRQRELVPPEKLAACHGLVIGVGAIGRQVCLQLAATGMPEMTLVDHDIVDVVNLAPQGFMPQDLGNPKVDATAAWCRRSWIRHCAVNRLRFLGMARRPAASAMSAIWSTASIV